jgi:tRNA G18 (ribose-2'-O)-methylase SpoU
MITSKSNKWLKLIREVRRGKSHDFWLIEGARAALEALGNGLRPAAILADSERISEENLELLHRHSPDRVFLAVGSLLDEVADQDSPRGLLALFPRSPREMPPLPAPAGLHLYADRIQDPRNLGALIRVGMAFGAKSIFISEGSCSANHPRVVRSSAGLALWAPLFERQKIGSALGYLEALSPLVAALDAQGDCLLNQMEFPPTVLLLIGTEGQGLGEDLLKASTRALAIPMAASVESLNLATAAAVACYEFERQRGL